MCRADIWVRRQRSCRAPWIFMSVTLLNMISYLPALLVLIGLSIQVATLFPLRRLIAMLPSGGLRGKRLAVMDLIVFLIAGYFGHRFSSPPARDFRPAIIREPTFPLLTVRPKTSVASYPGSSFVLDFLSMSRSVERAVVRRWFLLKSDLEVSTFSLTPGEGRT